MPYHLPVVSPVQRNGTSSLVAYRTSMPTRRRRLTRGERVGQALNHLMLPALGIVALAGVVLAIIVLSDTLRRWITGG